MTRLARAALGAVIACAFVPAHALNTYQAGFSLDTMPQAGITWDTYKDAGVSVTTREAIGVTTDPATGAPTPVWGTPLHNQIGQTLPSGPLDFGNTLVYNYGPSAFTQTSGRAEVGATTLGAQVEVRDVPAEGWALANWSRGFSLAAGASFTFSGLATLAITGTVPALDPVATLIGGDGDSFVNLLYHDGLSRAGAEISAWLSGDAATLGDVFDYVLGADGRLSITVTNRGADTLYGGLAAVTYVQSDAANVAAAIPEPATWLMLLGGAALVGGVARRRTGRTQGSLA